MMSIARGSACKDQLVHIAIDEVKVGGEIAAWTAKKIGGKGDVAVLAGPAGAQAFINLAKGYTDEMAKHPGIKIVFRHEMLLTRENGLKFGVTIVNGRRCEMHPGDLVLTPPWCWHGHINESDSRTVWFDAANIPLINDLDVNFFDPGNREGGAITRSGKSMKVTRPCGRHRGWLPKDHGHEGQISPKYRYPGEDTRRMLSGMRARSDGAKLLRYVNPLTGGSVMPTLDCYAMRLAKGQATQANRATWNMICMVVSGEGTSTIGDQTIDWSEKRYLHGPALDMGDAPGVIRACGPVHRDR